MTNDPNDFLALFGMPCWNCGKKNLHRTKDCPEPCGACGKPGHKKTKCPERAGRARAARVDRGGEVAQPGERSASVAARRPPPAQMVDPTAKALALIALLEEHGYTVRSRNNGWWEVCVMGEGESAVTAAGGSYEAALHATVQRMPAGSRLLRALVEEALALRVAREATGSAELKPTAEQLTGEHDETTHDAGVEQRAGEQSRSEAMRQEQARLLASVRAAIRGPVLLAARGMERELARELGEALGEDVVCCDHSERQIAIQLRRIDAGDYAAIVHSWMLAKAKSPFAEIAARRRIPLGILRHPRVSSCISALAEALGVRAH